MRHFRDNPEQSPTQSTRARASGRPTAALAGALLAGALAVLPAPRSLAADAGPEMVRVAGASAIAARLVDQGGKARLVFELTTPVEASAHALAKPDRIIVDLPEVAFRIDPNIGRARETAGKQAAAGGKRVADLVKSYRFGLLAPGRSRVVIDLARPAKILQVASVTLESGARLAIDLAATDAASFAAAAEQARAPPAPPPAPGLVMPAPAPAAANDKPLVVIDPGHGGVDVGAAGKHGELEKTIVLEFARALKAKIEEKGRLRAELTRTDDVFVALDDRVRFARKRNAALFLSIHADTLGEPHVEGATVYTVSARASDAEAAKVAASENRADQAAGLERQEDAEDIGDILIDLARRESRAYSRQFAQALVSKWGDAGSLNKNPSRSAGFVVLKAHDVPSVLLELGYLSSEKDRARLVSPEWRERAAASTAQAIEDYFSARGQNPPTPRQSAEAGARPQ
jgi:N-acetylmuramoyl-L-alanine amidase